MYPALAVLQAITDNSKVVWIGSQSGIESTLIQRAGITFEEIPAAGIHGVGLKKLPRNLGLLIQGYFSSRRIISRFKPDVILLTGGYLAVPIALASTGIPLLVVVPDIEPGLALKVVSMFANLIAVNSEESLKFYSNQKKVFISGYPIRSELANWKQAEARKVLDIDESLPVVLIFGGSKGAHSINQAVLDNLSTLLQTCQIIHISGEFDWPLVDAKRRELSDQEAERYHAFAYLHEEMGAALASADLVVSRAGASILGEFPIHGLPAILVPYPYAWRYQNVNARYLADRGAAIILEDSKLGQELFKTINLVLGDQIRMKKMRSAMQNLSRPNAATLIGQRLFSLAGERS